MGDNGDIDALLRRASRIAEHIFKDCGSLDPIWLIELADGKQEIIATPILAPDAPPPNTNTFWTSDCASFS